MSTNIKKLKPCSLLPSALCLAPTTNINADLLIANTSIEDWQGRKSREE